MENEKKISLIEVVIIGGIIATIIAMIYIMFVSSSEKKMYRKGLTTIPAMLEVENQKKGNDYIKMDELRNELLVKNGFTKNKENKYEDSQGNEIIFNQENVEITYPFKIASRVFSEYTNPTGELIDKFSINSDCNFNETSYGDRKCKLTIGLKNSK